MAPHLEDCEDVKMFKSIENMLTTYTPICGKEDGKQTLILNDFDFLLRI
jgi:hypothetical protein